MFTVAIGCGGTGGHVYPGLAIGAELRERGCRVLALLSGGGGGEHAARAKEMGLEALVVPSVRLPASRTGLPLFGFRFLVCGLSARRLLRSMGCDAVVGMGSFASAPVCLGAVLCGVPLVLHEGNAVVGRANRLFSRRARALAVSLPLAPGQHVHCTVVQTGLPVRQAIVDAARNSNLPRDDDFVQWGLEPDRETVLVFGGSQGAEALNAATPAGIARISGRRIQVIHLTGEGRAQAVGEAYERLGIAAVVREGVSAMERLYALADVVVCRAGASTLTELALLDKPAVLVPLPSAADDHQSANAKVFSCSFPAVRISQSEAMPERIGEAVEALLAGTVTVASADVPFVPNPTAAAAVADLVPGSNG
ncbi:MAG: UDP-N-acetylglucosamine--N-acetylmuramyl-(pentapeptide) pyrophosphoryl-undecaprenol N-acetylglucosamine transferase [Verrucomicrobiota bacterium]